MALKRETSLAVGLATAALVWGIYNSCLPTVADIRASEPDDRDAAAAEKAAAWTAATAVSAVSLIAKDPTVFILGGSMVVALSWLHKHANNYNPTMGVQMMPGSRQVMSEEQTVSGYTPA